MPPISVVQILRKEDLDYQKIILENSKFLELVKVEYIVYDNLKNHHVLKFIKNIKSARYFRKEFKDVKTSFQESAQLSTGVKIIFLRSDDVLNMENVQVLENIRPHILKSDLHKISKLKKDNFQYDHFNLLVKDKKTLWEKTKLLF
jgi:hypothetical protein